MSKKTIDLRQDVEYDFWINKNMKLESYLTTQFYSGDTLINFDFTPFMGGCLVVKQRHTSSNTLFLFTTEDNSLVFYDEGRFGLFKTDEEMQKIAEGEYVYSMYLIDGEGKRRAFTFGKFIVKNKIF